MNYKIFLLALLFAACTKQADIAQEEITVFEVEIDASEERNVARYEIEASRDGIQFIYIGEIPASQRPTYAKRVEVAGSGWRYARIKAVDLDKRFIYSEIITR